MIISWHCCSAHPLPYFLHSPVAGSMHISFPPTIVLSSLLLSFFPLLKFWFFMMIWFSVCWIQCYWLEISIICGLHSFWAQLTEIRVQVPGGICSQGSMHGLDLIQSSLPPAIVLSSFLLSFFALCKIIFFMVLGLVFMVVIEFRVQIQVPAVVCIFFVRNLQRFLYMLLDHPVE